MSDWAEWDRRTAARLEDAYMAEGAGARRVGVDGRVGGCLRAKRQHLAVPTDRGGTWLDVGCANGHLLVTMPVWAAERGSSC